jgi:hypothetical protein
MKVHPYYGNDGTGRDTYIQSVQAGVFSKWAEPRGVKFFTGTLRQPQPLRAPVAKEAQFKVSYHSDGSGRDTYVK